MARVAAAAAAAAAAGAKHATRYNCICPTPSHNLNAQQQVRQSRGMAKQVPRQEQQTGVNHFLQPPINKKLVISSQQEQGEQRQHCAQ
jgi:hypothetical protein